MSPTLQELKIMACGLAVSERAELVQFLLRSLDEEGEKDEGKIGKNCSPLPSSGWPRSGRARLSESRPRRS